MSDDNSRDEWDAMAEVTREVTCRPLPAEPGEVERLRGEVSLLQQEARIRRNISDGLVAEVATERAAVVAWLRDEVDATMEMYLPVQAETFLACAEAIERGAHRRKGGE